MEITKKIAERQIVSLNAEDNLKKLTYFDRVTNATALILGKLLTENVDNKYWKKLGYESFSDFIAQGGFSFTRRTAYNYLDLWEMYAKWRIDYEEFVEIPYSKLLRIRNVITSDNLKDWLARAKELSRSDLEVELMEVEIVGKEEPIGEYKPLPKVFRHSRCGKWIIEVAAEDCCLRWLKIFVKMAKKKIGS